MCLVEWNENLTSMPLSQQQREKRDKGKILGGKNYLIPLLAQCFHFVSQGVIMRNFFSLQN